VNASPGAIGPGQAPSPRRITMIAVGGSVRKLRIWQRGQLPTPSMALRMDGGLAIRGTRPTPAVVWCFGVLCRDLCPSEPGHAWM